MAARDESVSGAPFASRFPKLDWATATVRVSVEVENTTTVERQEFEIPVASLLALAEQSPRPASPSFGHSWPTCKACGKPHDSNVYGDGRPCPDWDPPEGFESTPLMADCPRCERKQFIWTDHADYFCGFCGTDLGPIFTVSVS